MLINRNKFFLLFLFSFVISNFAKVVEYAEDGYIQQAPQELVGQAEKVAQLFNFNKNYEVIVPKKSALQINPWNKFISYGINPQTKNPFILINPAWFSLMPTDQQDFLLARIFTAFDTGTPASMKFIPYIFMILGILLIIGLFVIMRRTLLSGYKVWMSVVAAMIIGGICNIFIIEKLQLKSIEYMNSQYDIRVINKALDKTQDREAAIKALEFYDASIKNEIKDGETFFASYQNLFEHYANQLKNK